MRALDDVGMSQTAFADKAGVHRVTVYRWGVETAFPAWVPWVLTECRMRKRQQARMMRHATGGKP